jgi:hypothetical protein
MPQAPQQQQPAPTWRERLFGGAPLRHRKAPRRAFSASAATTAAGVAGGMFLFDGLENLLGGHHGGGFFGGQPEVIENVTENNFFGRQQRHERWRSGFFVQRFCRRQLRQQLRRQQLDVSHDPRTRVRVRGSAFR